MKKLIIPTIFLSVLVFTACTTELEPIEGEVAIDEPVAVEVGNDEVESEETIEDLLLQAFADKYDSDYDGYEIVIDKQSGDFIYGKTERIANDYPGAWFYAAKVDGDWVIVVSGNGEPACEDLESYNFPADWVETSSCW